MSCGAHFAVLTDGYHRYPETTRLLLHVLAIFGSGRPGDQGFSDPACNGRYAVQRVGAEGNQRAALARRNINQMRRAYFQITAIIGFGIGQLQA